MFNHKVPAVINAMHDIIVGVFEHLKITSSLDLDIRIKYTERILRNSDMKKYRQVLLACKEMDRGTYGDQWTLIAVNNVTMDQFCTWDKVDDRNFDSDTINRVDQY